jgi:hypothetical protein
VLPRFLNLKPLDKISICQNVLVLSAVASFVFRTELSTLYVFLAVSFIAQASTTSVRFIIKYLGLNPVKINGPSADPLPV